MKKKFIFALAVPFILSSCGVTVNQIGDFNMISERNVDSNREYVRLATYVGASKKELKKSKAENLNQAINQTVRNVAGGDYVMNATVFQITHKNGKTYYAIEGDVWGLNERSFRGFNIGDKVKYEIGGVYYDGTISGFKQKSNEFIITTSKGRTIDIKVDNVYKAE